MVIRTWNISQSLSPPNVPLDKPYTRLSAETQILRAHLDEGIRRLSTEFAHAPFQAFAGAWLDPDCSRYRRHLWATNMRAILYKEWRVHLRADPRYPLLRRALALASVSLLMLDEESQEDDAAAPGNENIIFTTKRPKILARLGLTQADLAPNT